MTFDELMHTGWKKPALPPFGELLPMGVGYRSPTGEVVYYGADYCERTGIRHLGSPEALDSYVPLVFPMAPKPTQDSPQKSVPAPASHSSSSKSSVPMKTCLCCGETKPWDQTNQHHTVPREVGGHFSKQVRLCLVCHTTIHYLPNLQIAKLTIAEQFQFILATRPVTV